MKKLNLLTAVAIVLSAATMLYLAKTMAAQGSTDVCEAGSTPNSCLVKITDSNGSISVDHPTLTIHQDQNQTVEWMCTTDCTFDVDFSQPGGGPFNENRFHGSPQNPHANSGRAHKKGMFKYSVTVNGHTLDPQIIVH